MGLLINIDNGGTLTDICALAEAENAGAGQRVHHTKTLTTPHDLSRCFFDGLAKLSAEIWGEEDLTRLLRSTDHIRYSTTQGTNALVERKGPRLGLIVSDAAFAEALKQVPHGEDLARVLIDDRVAVLDTSLSGEALERAVVAAVNALTGEGANRIVGGFSGDGYVAAETATKRALLRKFPRHLLGAVPVLFSHELADDAVDTRRVWTSLLNSFLHPAMERFLYAAERKMRAEKTRNPLLIFRNDGDSARIAKTVAIKTYSSGPRGGLEGTKALADHYGFTRAVSFDVGGTTTDIGVVEAGAVRENRRGRADGVPVSFPLSNIVSAAAGGSSVLKGEGGGVAVGPESVGAVPGPASFGRGGTQATMTDVYLLQGLLDPASYFGGQLSLDAERARAAVKESIADPMGLSEADALKAAEDAWTGKIATSIRDFATVDADTVLIAFGGAGPLAAARIAEQLGATRVLIPGLAAVFSAFGVGFSDIAHHYEISLREGAEAARAEAVFRAQRDMFAEGFELDDCTLEWGALVGEGEAEAAVPFDGNGKPPAGASAITLIVRKPIPRPELPTRSEPKSYPAEEHGTRQFGGAPIPVVKVEEQGPGAEGQGPVVLEEAYFTSFVPEGWAFRFTENNDILLEKAG